MSLFREILQQIKGLLTWWVVISPWEQAVRVRMGKRVDVLNGGIHLKIPGADRLFVQSVRKRLTTFSSQTLTTQDGKPISLSGCISYSINDIGKLYDTLHHAESTIVGEVQGEIARFVTSRWFEDCQPPDIEEYIHEAADLAKYGLSNVNIFITSFVAVRTYRIINGELYQNNLGDSLSTTREVSTPDY